MAKTRTGETEPDAGALTHNPFARLALKQVPPTSGARRGTSEGTGTTSSRGATPPGDNTGAKASPSPQASTRPRLVRVRLEARGRSGKVITRVAGLPLANLQAIAQRLHEALGCPAGVEGEDVILQGSLSERAAAWLDGAGDLRAVPGGASEKRPALPIEPALQQIGTAAPIASGMHRSDVRVGRRVAIVLKADQGSAKLTYGVVREILTSSPTHPHGIKVRLETGEVGRVKSVYQE